MTPAGVFGVFVRAFGLYLSVTSGLTLFNVLWDQWDHVPAGLVIRLIATVLLGLIFLFRGDNLARRLYRRDPAYQEPM